MGGYDRLNLCVSLSFIIPIILQYDRPFADSDVLDLNDMKVVEDRGFLGSVKTMKIGTTRLAADKALSHTHSGSHWNSTKDSTDSAFGSTRYSESEDTSGTETIASYSIQGTKVADGQDEVNADLSLEDMWMRYSSLSEDSGNEDVDSDHSGPICTPSKASLLSLSLHQRNPEAVTDSAPQAACLSAQGNLSGRFETEDREELEDSVKRGRLNQVISVDCREEEEEYEGEEDDPYEFRDELPTILEEKNRFLTRMQSILVDSFIDGDDIDEMNSQSDDEVSTGTVESSGTTSSSISVWATLPSKTPPKRLSRPPRDFKSNDLRLDNVRYEIPAPDIQKRDQAVRLQCRGVLSSTDSDFTDCSTILAGNLHSEQDGLLPSHLLRGTNQKTNYCHSRTTRPPFQAICNSTMLSEMNHSEDAVSVRKATRRPRELELPLDGQGEMCLGEVPLNDALNPELNTLHDQVNRTSEADRSGHNVTPAGLHLPQNHKEVKGKSEKASDDNCGQMNFSTPAVRNCSKGNNDMNSVAQETSGITPRSVLRKGTRRSDFDSVRSPRFDTEEIMEIFRSPKPLIIPSVDVQDLDLTPRRKIRREVAATPTRSLRKALQDLQSPKAKVRTSGNHAPSSQTAKEIKPRGQGAPDETALGYLDSTAVAVEESDCDSVLERGVCLDSPTSQSRGKADNAEIDIDESFEGVSVLSPEVHTPRRSSARLKEARSLFASRQDNSVSEIPKTRGQRVETSSCTKATSVVSKLCVPETLESSHWRRSSRSDHNNIISSAPGARESRDYSHQTESEEPTKKQSTSNRPQRSVKTKASSRSPKDRIGSSSDSHVLPASRHSALKSKEVAVEQTLQHSKPSKYTPLEDNSRDSLNETPKTPVPSKTPSRPDRVKKCPLTPPTHISPSTLSSPLNRVSISTPSKFCGQREELRDSSGRRLSAQKKDRVTSVATTKLGLSEKNLRPKSKKGDKLKLDVTHMTIRLSDDSSEEDMEVDPYSLTADDSSPGPRLYHQRPKLQPSKKSSTKHSSRGDRYHDQVAPSKGSGKLRYGRTKEDHLSTLQYQNSNEDLAAGGNKSHSKNIRDSDPGVRSLHNRAGQLIELPRHSSVQRDSESLVSLRGSGTAVRTVHGPSMNKHACTSIQRSPPHSPPPSPIFLSEDTARLSRNSQLEKSSTSQSRTEMRREHSQHFSDEECNSSGDSAKFLSSKPDQIKIKSGTEPSGQLTSCMSPKHRKLSKTEWGVSPKLKTTIRCGQIITTPTKGFGTASPKFHKTCSPSHRGRVEKIQKMDRRSGSGSAKKSSNSLQRGQQVLKTAARKLIASPSSHRCDVRTMETSRPVVSSPLRANGCNVSSSYVCEGPGNCTKPFCFNCALSEIS
ncbi:uncharacterized protein LOC110973174 isoform X2 [Acanthaster planci]|uniref:Uncharacterized protein LOC110973174 isoform X2 n=1 Tax=Acanthaster planci TaxID=133434 RepID=A0A8B7XGY9_ACAPL|nr:uncharacterized protein LOC110973174 isoform X2 [Acanthaster planci]